MKPLIKYRTIKKFSSKYSVTEMCRFFGVSKSGYYDYLKRGEQPDHNAEVAEMIRERREQRYGRSLGCRRMQRWLLMEKGIKRNYKTIWRIMQRYGMLSECRRRRYYRHSEALHVYKNLLARDFSAAKPGTKWVTDITYIPTPQGTLYLSAVLDLYDRSIVAYRMSTRNDCKLVFDTVKLAIKKAATAERQLHSDQGFQYTSTGYLKLTKRYNITPSMSRRGNPYDNAVMENFFGMFKTEAFRPCRPQTIHQARMLVHDYIDYYNNERMRLK